MTTVHEAAMRQALKALESIHAGNMTPMAEKTWTAAIAALKAALAQQPALSTTSKSEQLLASHDHALRAEFQRMKAALAQQGDEYQRGFSDGMKEAPTGECWIRVIDEAMVGAHLGVADIADDYGTAKEKLNDLICWSVEADRDTAAPAPQPVVKTPPEWWPTVENILTEFGLDAISFVADFKKASGDYPAQIKQDIPAPQAQPTREITQTELHEIYCKDKSAGEWRRHAENYYAGFRAGRKYQAQQAPQAQQGEQQQPMAWYLPQGTDDSLFRDHRTVVACTGNKWEGWIPLYAGAAPIVETYIKEDKTPLSIEEVEQINAQWNYEIHGDRTRYIARMVEAAHGIGVQKQK